MPGPLWGLMILRGSCSCCWISCDMSECSAASSHGGLTRSEPLACFNYALHSYSSHMHTYEYPGSSATPWELRETCTKQQPSPQAVTVDGTGPPSPKIYYTTMTPSGLRHNKVMQDFLDQPKHLKSQSATAPEFRAPSRLEICSRRSAIASAGTTRTWSTRMAHCYRYVYVCMCA